MSADGLKLCGILTKPKVETRKCVILCHGITVDKDEHNGAFKGLASKLAEAGFAVFRFDFRGHGESEGKSIDVTVSGEKKDLEGAILFLRELGYEKFGMVAASFAGGAVSLFVGEHPDVASAIVLWNAGIDYESNMNPKTTWAKRNWGKPAFERVEKFGFTEIGSKKFKVGKALFSELIKLEPWKELQKAKIPILFVHGDKDTYIPYSESVKYSKLLGAKLITIHGAEHGFRDRKKDSELADSVTVDFFLKNL